MTTWSTRVVLIGLVFVLLPLGAQAQVDLEGWHPSQTEVMLLPKFCWGQFLGGKFKGPQYTLPRETCQAWNHYCPGLVALGRANRSFDNKRKRAYLMGARDQLRYTVGALRKYPRCPIRGQAMRTYRLIQQELSLTR
jgi:hypothetical protein